MTIKATVNKAKKKKKKKKKKKNFKVVTLKLDHLRSGQLRSFVNRCHRHHHHHHQHPLPRKKSIENCNGYLNL
jgi:hypothetical protein